MHLIAVTQIGHAGTPGRAFYERKLVEGKTKKEALRALKRRVSDLTPCGANSKSTSAAAEMSGPGGHSGTSL